MGKEITKEYSKGDFTIVWKPKSCIHAATCVNALPEVYDPKRKPWIQPENAEIEALKVQIDTCPSGALSYFMKNESESINPSNDTIKILVKPNGPLLVYGEEISIDNQGNELKKERVASFCRCGASENKPFCDGAHKKIGFIG